MGVAARSRSRSRRLTANDNSASTSPARGPTTVAATRCPRRSLTRRVKPAVAPSTTARSTSVCSTVRTRRPALAAGDPGPRSTAASSGSVNVTRGVAAGTRRRVPSTALVAAALACTPAVWVCRERA